MTAAAQNDIRKWLTRAKENGATHVLIVCDTFDYEDFPHEIKAGESAREIADRQYGYPGEKNMQRVMECYDLSLPIDDQIAESRAFHF